MIDKVRVTYFKKYRSQEFDISGNIVLAGPNNSGKSTLLQAIAVWNFAKRKWILARESGSKAK